MARRITWLFRVVAAVIAVSPGLWPAGSRAVEAESQATTSVGGGTFDLNDFLGAERYYTNGTSITGQNTIAVNLEAGHIWNGHETLQHVTAFYNASGTWGGGAVAPLYDRHATWVGMLIGGREATDSPSVRQEGIAPGTDLRSAAIATGWSGSAYALSFGISGTSYIVAFTNAFAAGDVVNSSYAYADAAGVDTFTIFTDALSFQNAGTLHVVSAGNSGPGSNTVGAPGSGYNTLTVGALGSANAFNSAASFSSRGPQDFGYTAGPNTVTVGGVRAAVDLAAPGESLVSAFYGGQTGGNNTNLAGSSNLGTNAGAYSSGLAGTSFAAPIVAGGAALVYSAAKTLPGLSGNAEAGQNMVVKSLLLTGADKTAGWSNGQATTNGVVTTAQALDWAVGAGRMNLEKTFDIQVNGQTGVAGQSAGVQGPVLGDGWDFGASLNGINNDYAISDVLLGGATFTTSLSWLRARRAVPVLNEIFLYDDAQADLNLSLWSLGSDFSFQSKVAESVSLYNTVEHLSFALPSTGLYGLRVSYAGNTFDNTGTWGSGTNVQTYGLAWDGAAVDTLYWNPSGTNGAWDGATASFNTAANGTGSATAATTTNTQVVFGAGTNLSGPVLVGGSRAASGLVVQSGAFSFDGTNSAGLTLGVGGVTRLSGADTETTFAHDLALLLAAAQAWINAAITDLLVEGAVGGTGDLALRADSSGGITLSGSVNPAGALSNSGTGTGTTTVSGALGGNVTAVTQNSATSKLVLAAPNSHTGPTTVQAGVLGLDSSTGGAAGATSAVSVAGGATLLLGQSDQVNDAAPITLSGGTIRRDGAVGEVFGNLNLTAASFLDYGASNAAGTLRFGTYTPGMLLTVQNFLPGNKLQFGNTLTQVQLDNGGLFSFSHGFTTGTEGGFFTITAIPEPRAILAASGLLAFMLWPSRRLLRRAARKIPRLTAPGRSTPPAVPPADARPPARMS